MAISAKAIVAYEPITLGTPNFKLESLTLRELKDDELLVRMVATGICHTDIAIAALGKDYEPFPRVLGHEAAGIVEKVGKNVKNAKPGSRVLLSPSACLNCYQCKTGHLGCCDAFHTLNITGDKSAFTRSDTALDGEERGCYGSMFGQSSFANISLVKDTSILDVTDLLRDEEELKLFAPMGCAFQTGAGTVTEVAKVGKGDNLVVMGLGGVGLSAVIAAKIQGCKTIIAIDRVSSRIELAKELGATSSINTSDASLDIGQEIKRLTDGLGATITIDSTADMTLINTALEFTAKSGKVVLVGITPPGIDLNIGLFAFVTNGRSLISSMVGDTIPTEYIPRIINWYREGKFPAEKFVKFYPAEDFQSAVEDMHRGSTVKPVLVW